MFIARDFMMRDRDTLYVTTAPFMQWMKIMQSVAPVVTFRGSARALGAF
jgi:polysaccharide export outer membrane protein